MKVHLPGVRVLRLVVFSNPGAIPYTLVAFNDVRDGDPVDGLAYSNAPLSSCAVAVFSLNQVGSEAVQRSVPRSATNFD
jgi:inorganic pyrophosphatase